MSMSPAATTAADNASASAGAISQRMPPVNAPTISRPPATITTIATVVAPPLAAPAKPATIATPINTIMPRAIPSRRATPAASPRAAPSSLGTRSQAAPYARRPAPPKKAPTMNAIRTITGSIEK
jgi:hypothetical protein